MSSNGEEPEGNKHVSKPQSNDSEESESSIEIIPDSFEVMLEEESDFEQVSNDDFEDQYINSLRMERRRSSVQKETSGFLSMIDEALDSILDKSDRKENPQRTSESNTQMSNTPREESTSAVYQHGSLASDESKLPQESLGRTSANGSTPTRENSSVSKTSNNTAQDSFKNGSTSSQITSASIGSTLKPQDPSSVSKILINTALESIITSEGSTKAQTSNGKTIEPSSTSQKNELAPNGSSHTRESNPSDTLTSTDEENAESSDESTSTVQKNIRFFESTFTSQENCPLSNEHKQRSRTVSSEPPTLKYDTSTSRRSRSVSGESTSVTAEHNAVSDNHASRPDVGKKPVGVSSTLNTHVGELVQARSSVSNEPRGNGSRSPTKHININYPQDCKLHVEMVKKAAFVSPEKYIPKWLSDGNESVKIPEDTDIVQTQNDSNPIEIPEAKLGHLNCGNEDVTTTVQKQADTNPPAETQRVSSLVQILKNILYYIPKSQSSSVATDPPKSSNAETEPNSEQKPVEESQKSELKDIPSVLISEGQYFRNDVPEGPPSPQRRTNNVGTSNSSPSPQRQNAELSKYSSSPQRQRINALGMSGSSVSPQKQTAHTAGISESLISSHRQGGMSGGSLSSQRHVGVSERSLSPQRQRFLNTIEMLERNVHIQRLSHPLESSNLSIPKIHVSNVDTEPPKPVSTPDTDPNSVEELTEKSQKSNLKDSVVLLKDESVSKQEPNDSTDAKASTSANSGTAMIEKPDSQDVLKLEQPNKDTRVAGLSGISPPKNPLESQLDSSDEACLYNKIIRVGEFVVNLVKKMLYQNKKLARQFPQNYLVRYIKAALIRLQEAVTNATDHIHKYTVSPPAEAELRECKQYLAVSFRIITGHFNSLRSDMKKMARLVQCLSLEFSPISEMTSMLLNLKLLLLDFGETCYRVAEINESVLEEKNEEEK